MSGLAYRPMREGDIAWVAEQERELHLFPWTAGNFSDALQAGYSAWLQYDGEQPCAYALMLLVVDEAHLLDLSVVRSAQNRGCGRALLDHLCERARAAGATQMFLEVRPSNTAALALYRRAGFAEIGRRKGYYPALEGREDAIVMSLPL
ncbi:ribosomal-protein-alanine N-acetyltransferase [Pseudothauera lacus]|uniref:[Ribosomal protein bS18]-alanine N-acetyltransferase n=1 Tax=Pseudothauera lacus TaxID=2136175 RepID=A0A2T4IKD6_9RHOO|nr:ribosomal-protein-alanine N-acetyltransferase [Pseudothauera lacus]